MTSLGESLEQFVREVVNERVDERVDDQMGSSVSDYLDADPSKIESAVEDVLKSSDLVETAVKNAADNGDLDDAIEKAIESSLNEQQIENTVETAVEKTLDGMDIEDTVGTETEKYLERHLVDEVNESVTYQLTENEEVQTALVNKMIEIEKFAALVRKIVREEIDNVFNEPNG